MIKHNIHKALWRARSAIEFDKSIPIIKSPYYSSTKKIKRAIAYEQTTQTKRSRSQPLLNVNQRRNLTEFPESIVNFGDYQDYIIVLPEAIPIDPRNNETTRLPKNGDPELNFAKLNLETVYKGLSYCVVNFEEFISDAESDESFNTERSFDDFIKEVGKHQYPMDAAKGILSSLLVLDKSIYARQEIQELLLRFDFARRKKKMNKFREMLDEYALRNHYKLSEVDRYLLHHYNPTKLSRLSGVKHLDISEMIMIEQHISEYSRLFQANMFNANKLYSVTLDDPDILASIFNQFQQNDAQKNTRTPIIVDSSTYSKFMQVCPSRFIRQAVWMNHRQRCSPKSLAEHNNNPMINQIRSFKRKRADHMGYRNHVDFKLAKAMANSKLEIQGSLEAINTLNAPKLKNLMEELTNFAYQNSFDDTDRMGLQEYDIDFWSRKYKYDVLIGESEATIRTHFSLSSVHGGLVRYFKDYFDIGIQALDDGKEDSCGITGARLFEISRKGKKLGRVLSKTQECELFEDSSSRLVYIRPRNTYLETEPLLLLASKLRSTSETSREVQLNFDDVIQIFYSWASLLNRLMFNYRHYELNLLGGLEEDVEKLLPHLCLEHILSDSRIVQSCSDQSSNQLDSRMTKKLLDSTKHLRPLSTWKELYLAELDLEMHSQQRDLHGLASEIYRKYSPFERNPEDYDYCTMSSIVVGPNDGCQYGNLWSRQLAGYIHNNIEEKTSSTGGYHVAEIRKFNTSLLDSLYSPEKPGQTDEKLLSLIGSRFKASQPCPGMI